MRSVAMSQEYDAVLIVSFGGPEGMDDVMPFLDNVLRGRNVPTERKLEVAEHYALFNGVSPINDYNRKLAGQLKTELESRGFGLPIYIGNRNWHPLLPDTIQRMADDGVKRAVAFVTSAFGSYSSCRQYRENIDAAREIVGANAPEIDKIRLFYNHPDFIECNVRKIESALNEFPEDHRQAVAVTFTAHSIPVSMANNCQYADQLAESCRLTAEKLGVTSWNLVYQSRSGSPTQPWLEPDICDELIRLKKFGFQEVIIAPIGFLTDHIEVLFDLDTEAREVCDEQNIKMIRAGTIGDDPLFVSMVADLIRERIDPETTCSYLGELGLTPDQCSPDCCKFEPT